MLPLTMQPRVIGSTYDPTNIEAWRWNKMRRYDQIMRDVTYRSPARWLAIDDDTLGWPSAKLRQIVATDPVQGLRREITQLALEQSLADIFA